ncbi:tumor necrosis factor receptor superfamily member 6B isoform X1 [Anolis carolinensis]|uniref:tumor necrosis factor receptor superfamily member 6B isoform X1 n=1 Tax=Anolis carolinensis TaxID=28377 RepID=UPI002F2B5B9F
MQRQSYICKSLLFSGLWFLQWDFIFFTNVSTLTYVYSCLLFQGVICSSFLLLLGLPVSFSQPTYPWKDPDTREALECQQCPPGTYVSHHCTKESKTECKPCPDLHYTEYWNYLNSCLYCNVFCNFMEEEAQPCNFTQNRVCRCKPGYHSEQDFCIKHSSCPPGSEVAQMGNPYQDTKCQECPQGTFSSTSSMDPCQPHQNCSAQDLEVNVPGNQFHDTLCTACKLKNPNRTSDGLEDWLGSEECQDAFIDFVPYSIKSAKRLRNLNRYFGVRSSRLANNARKSPLQLQAELHARLVVLKESGGKLQLVKILQEIFQHKIFQHPHKKCLFL